MSSCPSRPGETHSPSACDGSIRRAFDLIGKRWNGVIIATLTGGSIGFADLRRAIDGISDSMLSDRLSELSAAGVVLRTVDPGPPVAVTYGLTDGGRALMPALDALADWAAEHLVS